MITKIIKIENIGVFSDYPPKGHSCPVFDKHNIIYGMNGAGKTTLSTLLKNLADEEGKKNIVSSYPEICYEIQTSDDDRNDKEICSTVNDIFLPIKVFNRDYIEENVEFAKGQAKFLIGADIIKKDKEVIKKEKYLKKVEKVKLYIARRIADKVKIFEESFTKVAKHIKADGNIDVYNAGHAKKDYANKNFIKENLGKKLEEEMRTVRSETKKDHLYIMLDNKIREIIEDAKELCKQTASSVILKDLENATEEILRWVEQGVHTHHLHDDKKSENCLFCLNPLSKERVVRLQGHFSKGDEILKTKINELIEKIRQWEKQIEDNIRFVDEGLLYPGPSIAYKVIQDRIIDDRKKLLGWPKDIKKELVRKKQNTSDDFTFDMEILQTSLFENIKEINLKIEEHNKQNSHIEDIKAKAVNAIKGHHLAIISPKIEKNEDEKNIFENWNIKVQSIDSKTSSKIDILKQNLQAESKVCDYINHYIKGFFGREEIKFSLTKGQDGYIIMRGSRIAKKLSEGEKAAVALIYFMSELQGKDKNEMQANAELQNNVDKHIVVIDDPVSSLDSNFLYSAFSLLKTLRENENIEQMFILTHSFQFLKMLLNPKIPECKYLMVKNMIVGEKRHAYIDKLDKRLRNFNSEYQYLFYELYKFNENKSTNIDAAYPIPNMTRKFLEIFLDFQMSSGEGLKGKFIELRDRLEKENDKNPDIVAIDKFINQNSHADIADIDPILLVHHVEEILPAVFDLVKAENEVQYARLEAKAKQVVEKDERDNKKNYPTPLPPQIHN